MKTWKDTWKSLSPLEKAMVVLRNGCCICILLAALLSVVGISGVVDAVIWLLPVVGISQAVLSWKRSRATAVFFGAGAVFFFIVYFISRD
ncbi:MAG: hypothetical protein IJA75_00620 [Oscillospiraceae bacterium]|nr:hypothetical protein [Oscillospiraceae bacterium]